MKLVWLVLKMSRSYSFNIRTLFSSFGAFYGERGGGCKVTNPTSNVFSLLTFITPKHTSDKCSYKPYTKHSNNKQNVRVRYKKQQHSHHLGTIKVLEKCTKNLIGYSRLALNNHESNIDC